MDTLIAPVLSALKENHANSKLEDVERAFLVAQKAHEGQLRKSGELYITHPVAVAKILAELGLNSETIIAALLHDTVEDTSYSLKELRRDFGDEITALVDGVTKLDRLTYGPTAEAETVRKMVVRGREFNEIYDLVGIRVLVDDVRDCYAVLGSIHARWSPIPGRFKDYIAMPKFNLYQSLHTTVIGPTGKAIEIQIRTFDMHSRAEFGIAAHWKYKQGHENNENSPEMLWLRQLHEWQKETEDPSEFLEALRFDLGSPEVCVFTP